MQPYDKLFIYLNVKSLLHLFDQFHNLVGMKFELLRVDLPDFIDQLFKADLFVAEIADEFNLAQ